MATARNVLAALAGDIKLDVAAIGDSPGWSKEKPLRMEIKS
jgi:hypothetical protein